MDNGRCDMHGGKATGRPVIHGRRSKFLPARLMERAEEALQDPEMVGLLEDIALVEALMIDRFQALGEESHAQLWGQAMKAYSKLDAAGPDLDGEAAAAFHALGRVLENGAGRMAAEQEILSLQEHKRRLADTEIKRQHTLNQFLTAKQANALLAVLLSIIGKFVKDPDDRKAVGRELIGVFRSKPGDSPGI